MYDDAGGLYPSHTAPAPPYLGYPYMGEGAVLFSTGLLYSKRVLLDLGSKKQLVVINLITLLIN
jgi:hypothetical protein